MDERMIPGIVIASTAENAEMTNGDISPTLMARAGTGGNQLPIVCLLKCYGLSRSFLKGGNGSNGGLPVEEDIQPSITANGCGAVCYPIACDARGNMTNDGTITATLTGDHQNRITDYTTIVMVPNETD